MRRGRGTEDGSRGEDIGTRPRGAVRARKKREKDDDDDDEGEAEWGGGCTSLTGKSRSRRGRSSARFACAVSAEKPALWAVVALQKRRGGRATSHIGSLTMAAVVLSPRVLASSREWERLWTAKSDGRQGGCRFSEPDRSLLILRAFAVLPLRCPSLLSLAVSGSPTAAGTSRDMQCTSRSSA